MRKWVLGQFAEAPASSRQLGGRRDGGAAEALDASLNSRRERWNQRMAVTRLIVTQIALVLWGRRSVIRVARRIVRHPAVRQRIDRPGKRCVGLAILCVTAQGEEEIA